MAEIPNIRIGSDVTIHVTLADGGVKVSWADLEQVTARIYSELRRAVAGPCTVKVNAEDSYTLDVLYEAGRPQYTGIQRLIVSGIYRGVHKTYDAVVCNFVATTEEAVGTIEVELADYTAEGTAGITVMDIDTSVLEGAIRDAKAATVSANQAAADAVALDKEVAANEEERKANEEERKSNEDTRKSNETTRKSAETIRKNNEVKRGESEEARALAEEERRKAEEARAAAELERAAAEAKRGESESARELAEEERRKAEESRKSAETAREAKASKTIAQVKSDTAAAVEKADAATEGATTATTAAKEATTAAQTATTEAQQATTDANAAAKAATEAKEAIEQDTAVVKTSAQELTDEQAAQARENIGAGKQTDVERIQETLGHYTQRADIVLTAKETGVAISSDGVKVSKSGWAIAEFVAEKGVEYLFKPGVTDGSVCIFAQMITSKETRSIDYTYTYNDDGNVATATATYNGATHTYTFSYDEETGVQTITDESGTIVSALPYQYETSVGSYLPMTRLNAGAELPEDGYCRLMSHFQGNASLKVVVSYKVGSADLTMRVVKDGVFASVATQLGNLSGNISSTQSALASVEQDVASLDTFVEDNPSIGQYDFPELPLLCGQPPILQGYGTPQESVVPINWKQYVPDTDEGYDWTGRPSALNQQYINLSATTGGNYIAVWEDEATRELKWKAL